MQDKFNLLSNKTYVDPEESIEYPPVALSYGQYKIRDNYYPIPIGTYGNFSFIQAAPKSKKTFLVSMLCAVYLSNQTKLTGKIKGHRNNKRLVHFDTEQGRFHAQKVFRRVLDISNEDSEMYDTYALRVLSVKERIDFIELYLERYGSELGMMVIDGIADLVMDVNDIKESSDIVQKILRWSEFHNIHIICVIHTNFNSNKATGHLGSHLEKKTETQIQLNVSEDNEDIVKVTCKRSRSFAFEEFNFEVTKDGIPIVLDKIDNLLRLNNGTKFKF
mgnify:CR=1 FL=1|tara:strand:+ start:538 stop:1362 length:825 start_codon:yes stop_codon:yes gene_type:complete